MYNSNLISYVSGETHSKILCEEDIYYLMRQSQRQQVIEIIYHSQGSVDRGVES
jgi:hypothetical protein